MILYPILGSGFLPHLKLPATEFGGGRDILLSLPCLVATAKVLAAGETVLLAKPGTVPQDWWSADQHGQSIMMTLRGELILTALPSTAHACMSYEVG